MLIVLVGARGAGKTTIQNALRDSGIEILQPSTTRPPRFEGEKEYDFVANWKAANYAWSTLVRDDNYGMRRSELNKARTKTCVTVFDPLTLSIFEGKRRDLGVESMTIGLDTIRDILEQRRRVGNEENRTIDEAEFERVRAVIAQCDLVVTGNENVVVSCILTLIGLIEGRGGVVTKQHLVSLMRADAMLTNAQEANIKSASYDLRVGKEILWQGSIIELTEASPRFEIPAYSYAIVSALEHANLPPCVIGRFDLKVSYFFEGFILSNGPQVDPGYKGALFCMIYNGSGRSRILTLGNHFCTIDFTTTVDVTEGYRQKYQLKQRMAQFVTEESVIGGGGSIVDLVQKKVKAVESKVSGIKRNFWTIAAAFIALGVVVPTLAVPVLWMEIGEIHREKANIEESQRRTTALLYIAQRERAQAQQLLEQASRVLARRKRG